MPSSLWLCRSPTTFRHARLTKRSNLRSSAINSPLMRPAWGGHIPSPTPARRRGARTRPIITASQNAQDTAMTRFPFSAHSSPACRPNSSGTQLIPCLYKKKLRKQAPRKRKSPHTMTITLRSQLPCADRDRRQRKQQGVPDQKKHKQRHLLPLRRRAFIRPLFRRY